MRPFLFVALSICAAPVDADQVTPADAKLAPQIYQDDRGYWGCGVRVLILSADATVVKGGEFSLSVATRPSIGGMFKAGGMRCVAPCNDTDDLKYIHGRDYLLSTARDGVPLRLQRTMPADDPTFTMATTDGVDAMDVLMKIVNGDRLLFAYTPDGSNLREAFVFAAKAMTPDERASFNLCLDAILKK